jgi:hypothetical protein
MGIILLFVDFITCESQTRCPRGNSGSVAILHKNHLPQTMFSIKGLAVGDCHIVYQTTRGITYKMAGKLWIAVLCLFFVAIQAKTVKHESIQKLVPGYPVHTFLSDYQEFNVHDVNTGRRVNRRTHDVPVPNAVKQTQDEPKIENRFAIRGPGCPTGYVATGGFCFPDYD